jgi:exonuclease VII small subunit
VRAVRRAYCRAQAKPQEQQTMNPETVTILISFAVLVLQIVQVVRYVRLVAEVERVTTELDQTLNRLHRAIELTREVYSCVFRATEYLDSLAFQVFREYEKDKEVLWQDQARYQHIVRQAENNASLYSTLIELKAISNVIGDDELKALIGAIDQWMQHFNPAANQGERVEKVKELGEIIKAIQEKILELINLRLSARI